MTQYIDGRFQGINREEDAINQNFALRGTFCKKKFKKIEEYTRIRKRKKKNKKIHLSFQMTRFQSFDMAISNFIPPLLILHFP